MPSRLQYSDQASEDLASLDLSVARRILDKLDFFVKQNNPLRWAKRLTSSQCGEYRFRVGDYRVIFDVAKDGTVTVLLILAIKHRRHVYD